MKPDTASDQKFRETKVFLITFFLRKKNPFEMDSRKYFQVNGKFRQINVCTYIFHTDGFDERNKKRQLTNDILGIESKMTHT